MNDILNDALRVLITKRFSVIVGGEFERTTNFLGLVNLLSDYSDFFRYTKPQQAAYFRKFVKEKEAYVDANITVKFK